MRAPHHWQVPIGKTGPPPPRLQQDSANLYWVPAVYQAAGAGDSHGPRPHPCSSLKSAVGSQEPKWWGSWAQARRRVLTPPGKSGRLPSWRREG